MTSKHYDTFIDATQEYAKNKELKKEDIIVLQKWVVTQPHLPNISELDLIFFLQSCYFKIEEAKKYIDRFYTLRARCPEYFKNRRASINHKILDTCLFTPLPKLTREGYQIIFCKYIDYDPSNQVLQELIKSYDMSLMLMLRQQGTASGHIMLTDLSGMRLGHVEEISTKHLKEFFFYIQKALPIRLKYYIYINIPPFMDQFLALMRPFLTKELLDKTLFFTDEIDELYKIIPKECLPSDYGGKVNSISQLIKKRNENFLAHEDYFVEGEKEIADESKRVGKPTNVEDIFDETIFNSFVNIEQEYEKNKELKREDVQLLNEWVVKQPHLPHITEFYLILFLHRSHYNIDEAKKIIERFYTLRADFPEMFKNRNPSLTSKTLETALMTALPRLTQQGHQIIYSKLKDSNPDNFILTEQLRQLDMCIMLTLHQLGTVSGHTLLSDLSELTYEHITKIKPEVLEKFWFYFQEALPFHFKYYIFINTPPCFDQLMALMKPYIKKEILDKTYLFTDDFEELYKLVPKECLPSDYGGEADSIEELTKKRAENFLANESFFQEYDKQIADESKRIGKSKNLEDIFDKTKFDTFMNVENEYSKNKELKKADIRLLQEWVANQPHLPRISELYLILFLHRCYYDVEATKKYIESSYTTKAQWPEFFTNRSASIHAKNTETMLFAPLPKRTPLGYEIFYITFLDSNLDTFHEIEQIKSFDMSVALMLNQKGTAPGHIILTDARDFTIEHICKLSPDVMENIFFYIQEILPIRLVNLVYINIPPCMDSFLNLIKPMLKKEFFDKIKLYTDNFDELYELIPKECFPSDYGGEADSIEELRRKRLENLLAHESFLVEDEKQMADESKRSKLSTNENTLLKPAYEETTFDVFVDVGREYEKNKQLKKEEVELLRDWVTKQPHLPQVSELYLIFFLHRCYYNIESAKKWIETFYTARAHLPELFWNRSVLLNEKIFDTALLAPLSKLTPQGYQILFCKLLDVNPDKFVLEQQIINFDMVTLLMIHQTGTVPGHIFLTDLSGMTLQHIAKLRPLMIKKFFYYIQDAIPHRLIHFIFINVPPYMSSFWALAKTFLKNEFLDKLQLYSDDFDKVYQFIPQECFPSDYGGKSESIEELTRKSRENLLANQRFFAEDEKAMANESKRVGKPISTANVFEEEELFSSTYGV